MIALKILSLLLLLGAVMLGVQTAYAQASTWWARRINQYAVWVTEAFAAMLQDMSVERAKRLISLTVLCGFVLGFLLGGTLTSRFVLAGVGALGAYFVPRLFVLNARKQRLETIDDQLVDALGLMGNSLKAGLSLQQALELVVREMKPPIADEVGRVVKEMHLGRLTDDALRRFAERVPLEDLRLAVDSILMLREAGGNLSETFSVIAQTIVERKKVEGKIKAMTAQGTTQGAIMCMMPIVLMLVFTMMDASYMQPFFTTALGWLMMTVVFGLDAIGLWLMLKLVKVDV